MLSFAGVKFRNNSLSENSLPNELSNPYRIEQSYYSIKIMNGFPYLLQFMLLELIVAVKII